MLLGKTHYVNGQRIWELNGNRLTFYFKSGTIKAEGLYENEKMQGDWKFYRENKQLWQTGQLQDDMKHGLWIRYGKDDKIEYEEFFIKGKAEKKKKI